MSRLRLSSIWLLVLVAVLIAFRLALPSMVAAEVNRKIDKMGSYHGSLKEVDIHLWRGAYSIRELAIVKNTGKVPVPLLTAPKVDLSIGWQQLFHGAVVGKAEFFQPQLNFVDADADAKKQGGGGVDWRQKLEALLPIRLDEVLVHDGTIAFKNVTSKPPVDLKATKVEARVVNLTNAAAEGKTRVAHFEGEARIFDQAKLDADGDFDPFGRADTFAFRAKVIDVDLTRANSFVKAYSGLEVAKGRGDFVMELTANKGQVKGYAKPLLRDLQIFSWKEDVEQNGLNPFRLAWKTVTAFAVNLFTNRKHDQFGTRVELSGTIDKRNVDVLGAVIGIVRNAFVEAYKPDFESLQKDASAPKADK